MFSMESSRFRSVFCERRKHHGAGCSGQNPVPHLLFSSFVLDFDYEYGYGSYRGGYPDPYYNGYFPYAPGDYYYGEYAARGGARGRPSSGVSWSASFA